ncbi:MAG TPA: hypothetical protein VK898_19170, partial [Chloroflexota bacterium]|nr:hypothetical protein [Chloroflexota bacterium]
MRRLRPSWSVFERPQGHDQAGAGEVQVGDIQCHQLGAAEGAGDAEQQQCAVTQANAHIRQLLEHELEVADDGGCL